MTSLTSHGRMDMEARGELHLLFIAARQKSELHYREVDFLGYVIQEGSVCMQPGKDHTCARRYDDFWALLIFTGGSSRTLVPLLNLSQTNSGDRLGGSGGPPKVERSFEGLKATFIIALVLQRPDPGKPFLVEVDAADTGVGAVLSQHTGERGGFKPIAYFSQKLSLTEQNCGVGDLGLLAMKLAFKEWRHWTPLYSIH
ncbi:hypothetical protein P4O66_010559 [Electrophorus voltai]|uniref:Reverse transcriptase/retrotransposon-derived protein RNase H-like domain-containing protein n=1 Tax=Electrophorus voltai TaxID=2609070 RepID=A0AAD9DVE9_9TELE|nr:hypothetical protein P4O66_010559 [Electrophorus voltai]